MKKKFFFVVVLCLLAAACQSTPDDSPTLEIKNAWIRAMGGMQSVATMEGEMPGMHGAAGGMNSAAYMVLENRGGVADRLLRVESDVARAIELHLSEEKDGVMRMSPVNYIEVPSNGKAELKPGGYHVMLIGLMKELKPGDIVLLNLVFENSGVIQVEAEVRNP